MPPSEKKLYQSQDAEIKSQDPEIKSQDPEIKSQDLEKKNQDPEIKCYLSVMACPAIPFPNAHNITCNVQKILLKHYFHHW